MSVILPKCCPSGMGFFNSSKCASLLGPDLAPAVYHLNYDGEPVLSSATITGYTFGIPHCPNQKFRLYPGDSFRFLEDGALWRPGVPLEYQYCLETFVQDEGIFPILCFPDYDQDGVTYLAYPTGMILSLPFCLATLLVYALLPELRNLSGRCIISEVFAIIVAYIVMASIQLFTDFMSLEVCCTSAYTIQFFFLAVFFWLNVMCFDIYWAFSGFKKLTGSAKESERKKFLFYSVYAWGGPLVILAITLIMDYAGVVPESSPFKPNMGKNKCFFDTKTSTWLYFYGPMGVLIFFNLLMFATTARRIFVHTRETSVLKSKDSKRHDKNDKERFHLYWKLFIVMGINWVMELVSWMCGGPQAIWYLPDITNTLQGVFIFIIFVCKRRIVRLLKQRLCHGDGLGIGDRSRSTKSSGGTSSTVTGVSSSGVGAQPLSQKQSRGFSSPEDSLSRLNSQYDSDAQI